MPPKDKYTDPELRDQVKEEIHNSDKGGAPGQWSARKAQMMASEYKKRGGGYTTDKKDKDESQKHLDQWTEEEWQTKEGSGEAKHEDGTRSRYLPKKAWDQLSKEEKEETERKKVAESKKGKQFVENTTKAKKAGKNARRQDDKATPKRNTRSRQAKEQAGQDDETRADDHDSASQSAQDNLVSGVDEASPEETEHADEAPDEAQDKGEQTGQKRGRKQNPAATPNKKQKDDSGKGSKSVGSRKDPAEPSAQPGSKDRVPKKGQGVHWKALPGYVQGSVVEIVRTEKKVDGKTVKGSKDDPRIVLKSSSSGKIAVHKPEAVFFD